MRFSTSHVGHLLGHRDASTFLDYEHGSRLPTLINGLRLAIILRTPVEFLFGGLFDELHRQIRAEEERLAHPEQQTLF